MALYKYEAYIRENTEPIFDGINGPGAAAPRSGIYRCMGCHREAACNEHQPLPPQNHHQHSQAQGTIRWRLIVYADHREK
jgi:hypothetical protein